MAADLAGMCGHHRTPESLPFKYEQCDSYEVTTIFEEWLLKEAKEQIVWKPTKHRGDLCVLF